MTKEQSNQKTILINNPKKLQIAHAVLKEAGFLCTGSWFNNNECFEKDGISYKFDFPIWNGHKVRIVERF
jgi:hypothetical protein